MTEILAMIKKYWVILLIGLLIRILVAAFTYHPDIRAQALGSVSFLLGHFDPYQYSRDLAPYIILDKLPLSYLVELPFHFIFRFLSLGGGDEITFYLSASQLLGRTDLMIYLLYAKIPLLLADMILGLLL